MGTRKYNIYAADFETTVYDDQTYTEVWLGGFCELFTEDIQIFGSIDDTFTAIENLKGNQIIYFHNLKFDGSFWLDYLLRRKKYTQAYTISGDDISSIKWMNEKEMPNKSFMYSISDRGQWYSFTIKVNNKYIELRDSLKLLPFKLYEIGKSFKTNHQKLEMEYKGFRYANCPVSDKEKDYFKNDIFVLKEALEIMYTEGHTKLTIGSCCLQEFKNTLIMGDYDTLFPDLSKIELNEERWGAKNVDAWVRKSYRGGWCYLVPEKANNVYKTRRPRFKGNAKNRHHRYKGVTADVNSLYPSVMHSSSGNAYPIGKPILWNGNNIPKDAKRKNTYYYVKIKTRFYIKEGKLPFIQIKGNMMYNGTENLITSDYYDKKTGKYYEKYIDINGNEKDTRVELTLSQTDYERIKEHYNLVDCEIIQGMWFYTATGLFDEYINKYAKIKKESKGAKRTLAKLFLNNLYGKLASSKISSFKIARLVDDEIKFYDVYAEDKKCGYIAAGAAVTSYARDFTICAAQKNFHGANKNGFIYADTDSIHCNLKANEVTGIKIDPIDFNSWKLESYWSESIYVRQKTYIERVTHEDGAEIKNPYLNIKCAGMPQNCKDLLAASIDGNEIKIKSEDEKEFVSHRRKLTDFKKGLCVPSKLMPKRIIGGIVLKETTFKIN